MIIQVYFESPPATPTSTPADLILARFLTLLINQYSLSRSHMKNQKLNNNK